MQKIKYKGNYITVTEEEISGHTYERVKLRKGVHVIPYSNDGKIMLMNEKREHEDKSRWKLVSGWVDKEGGSILDHAIDELAEEVAYSAENWQEIYSSDYVDKTISPSAYYFTCNNLLKLENPPENPDTGFVLGYDWFSFDEIFAMMSQNKILRDDSIMVALHFLYEKNK